MMILIYIIPWAIIGRALYKPKKGIGIPMIQGFMTGLAFILLYIGWLYLPFGLAFDKTSNNLVVYNPTGAYRVLYRSPFNKLLEGSDTGVVIDYDRYNEYKKNGKIDDISLSDLAYKRRHFKGTDAVEASAPYDKLVLVSYYLIILMFSLSILVAQVNMKAFKLMFPWIILGTFFTLIQATSWFWNPTVKASAHGFVIKRQLFTLGLSFCLTAILIVLKINNV